MQYKEKKWNEIEQVLSENFQENEFLAEKLKQLKVNLDGNQKISNVVKENERLRNEIEGL